MIPMELLGVRVELPSNTPIVVLRSTEEEVSRLLPIFIGGTEATAIALAQEGVKPPRPMTHDLFAEVIDNMEVTMERVVITELRERTFFAEMHLRSPAEARVQSARPSDAIALAVRLDVPIFASEEILAEAGYPEEPDPEEQAETMVEEFKDFIDNVSPEDFGETS
ncbi:MAG: bifunctional nuclease family protein [Acidimicrobiales bacterium]|nr:bifunctional nuclease family protein [Acidimicrobiales bacterium]RZV46216.1 MAG: bifunctional nuclease family protein [Acidimicrobiales bacterium]